MFNFYSDITEDFSYIIDGNSSQRAASCLDQDYEQVFSKAHHNTSCILAEHPVLLIIIPALGDQQKCVTTSPGCKGRAQPAQWKQSGRSALWEQASVKNEQEVMATPKILTDSSLLL